MNIKYKWLHCCSECRYCGIHGEVDWLVAEDGAKILSAHAGLGKQEIEQLPVHPDCHCDYGDW